jgi:hypothetical protein
MQVFFHTVLVLQSIYAGILPYCSSVSTSYQTLVQSIQCIWHICASTTLVFSQSYPLWFVVDEFFPTNPLINSILQLLKGLLCLLCDGAGPAT